MGVEPVVMSNTGARRTLRRLELEAYASVVSAFRAQGRLTGEKKTSLELLCKHFGISSERHRAEIRRAVNDELLSSVAYCISSSETDKAWRKEGQKLASTNPRFVSRQVTHLPQVLTSATIAATIGSQLGGTARVPSAPSISADSAPSSSPAKKVPSTTQLQNALKFIISQNPAAAPKLPDSTTTSKNQSPKLQQQQHGGPVSSLTSADTQTPPALKNTAISSPLKAASSTQTRASVKKPGQVAGTSKAVTGSATNTTQLKEAVKSVGKIASLLCEETLSSETSPSKPTTQVSNKPTSLGVETKSDMTVTSIESQTKKEDVKDISGSEKGTAVDVQSVGGSDNALKESAKEEAAKVPPSQTEVEAMEVSTEQPVLEKEVNNTKVEEKESQNLSHDQNVTTVAPDQNIVPRSSTEQDKTPKLSSDQQTQEHKDSSIDLENATPKVSITSREEIQQDLSTTSTAAIKASDTTLPVSAVAPIKPPEDQSLSQTKLTPSTTNTSSLSETTQLSINTTKPQGSRKRPPPLSHDVPPPKKPTMMDVNVPFTLPLSQQTTQPLVSDPEFTIPKATPIPSQPSTPLPVEVPTTPLTPASIQEFSQIDTTAEGLIESLCSDPSSLDDSVSTLASQLGLESVESSVIHLSEFLNIIQPDGTSLVPNKQSLSDKDPVPSLQTPSGTGPIPNPQPPIVMGPIPNPQAVTSSLKLENPVPESEAEKLRQVSSDVIADTQLPSQPCNTEQQTALSSVREPETEKLKLHTPSAETAVNISRASAPSEPPTDFPITPPLHQILSPTPTQTVTPTNILAPTSPQLHPLDISTAAAPPQLMSPAIATPYPQSPVVEKQPLTPAINVVAPLGQTPTVSTPPDVVESKELEKGEQSSDSEMLDFTDIGSLLGLADELLGDMSQEVAESIETLALLDEQSSRVTWK